MESVYFYDKKIEKEITKILKDDAFMRISYFVRESNVLHSGKSGCILYVRASPEEIKLLEDKLTALDAEKITGTEEKTIIETFKKEEEDAASGMGMIFGGLTFS